MANFMLCVYYHDRKNWGWGWKSLLYKSRVTPQKKRKKSHILVSLMVLYFCFLSSGPTCSFCTGPCKLCSQSSNDNFIQALKEYGLTGLAKIQLNQLTEFFNDCRKTEAMLQTYNAVGLARVLNWNQISLMGPGQSFYPTTYLKHHSLHSFRLIRITYLRLILKPSCRF